MSAARPIRLLAVHHGGGVGGAPVSLLTLLAALNPARFAVRALFTEPGPIQAYARSLGVPAAVVPTGGAFFYSAHARLEARTFARFLRTFPAAVRVARATLRRERPDMLHLNTSVLLAWGAAAAREEIPVVWVVREVLGPNPALRAWHARLMLCRAREVVGISEAVRACFPRGAGVRLVYNAVDPATFASVGPGEAAAVRAELGVAPDEPLVMAIGSVQRAKGHWLLLDALPRLLERAPRARLVLVAGGADAAYAASLRGQLKRALGWPLDSLDALLRDASARGVRERVLATGFRPDIARLLSAADVLVFPSLAAEGFGRPILEAMAAGRPVVATDIGPSRELLGPDAGVLVPPEPRALAGAVADLLADPPRRAWMGQAGRERVAERFTLERQVRQMAAIYTRAAGRA